MCLHFIYNHKHLVYKLKMLQYLAFLCISKLYNHYFLILLYMFNGMCQLLFPINRCSRPVNFLGIRFGDWTGQSTFSACFRFWLPLQDIWDYLNLLFASIFCIFCFYNQNLKVSQNNVWKNNFTHWKMYMCISLNLGADTLSLAGDVTYFDQSSDKFRIDVMHVQLVGFVLFTLLHLFAASDLSGLMLDLFFFIIVFP